MIRGLALLALLLGLAACGTDGDPRRPPAPEGEARTGVAVSGEARIGVVGSL